MIEPSVLKRIIEAAILAAPQPLSLAQMQALFDEAEAPGHDDISRVLETLQAESGERGVELAEVASGWRYQVRQDVFAWVARMWAERPPRYSRALLETLALIAYRQPITRAEIEQIRGVAVSTHIVRTLEEREWIRVVGHRDVPGRPALFGTSKGFLDYFNLKSLDQLPALSDLRDIDDLDPQLALEPVAMYPDAEAAPLALADVTRAAQDAIGDDADADEADAVACDADAAPAANIDPPTGEDGAEPANPPESSETPETSAAMAIDPQEHN